MTDQLAGIELFLMDVDGVLTDGRIHFDHTGGEVKSFHVHDAAGLIYWQRAGGRSGFISGRAAPIVEARAKELRIDEVHLGFLEKLPVFEEILERRGLRPEQVAYIGDDLLDLSILRRVGFSACPADGRPEVREAVDFVTPAKGGFGAVRDVVERLLRARGVWSLVVEKGGLP